MFLLLKKKKKTDVFGLKKEKKAEKDANFLLKKLTSLSKIGENMSTFFLKTLIFLGFKTPYD